jgi:hypothetical protein
MSILALLQAGHTPLLIKVVNFKELLDNMTMEYVSTQE